MENLRSPIVTLRNAIAGSAFRIAPERESGLKSFIDEADAAIVINDGPKFRFDINLTTSKITTTIATLEYLWASANAHLVLYDEYSKAQRAGEEYFDTGSIPRSYDALKLLDWAINNLMSTGREPWPQDLPKPVQYPKVPSDIHVANERFLCSTAWIIHHECAHIKLEHKSVFTTRSLTEEKEADISATKWILEECTDAQEFQKRTYGIAAAILALQGLADNTPSDTLSSHPRTFERLDYCLSEAGVSENEEVFAFCACIMQIQLTYYGINIAHEGDSFRELYENYLRAFARIGS